MKKILTLLCCLMLAFPALAEEAPAMQVHQINIGFADGYLIRIGDISIMIDGGNAQPEAPTDDVLNYLRAAGIDKLDAHIITHWHLDHCMNLNKVLSEFGDADTIVYAPSAAVHEDYAPLANGTYQQMKAGDVLHFGGMTLTCVGPAELGNDGRRNQDSLNFVVQYGEKRILFTGDFAASKNINTAFKDLCTNVDVLKFPHHGMQPYEIGNQACRTTNPRYVIVPGVANKYKIWDFLDDHGADFPKENVYTVADGNIVILTDGQTLEFRTQVTLEELGAL